ncbi:MAG: hypothetical protein J0L72_04205 [Armatimonadetes bacterium]|nr:hypothetical protein [Armatimonadota bacterium]
MLKASSASESYAYDANGNMIWRVADGKESAYSWNKENMLVNVVYKGSPETDAEFTYNAFNQKVLESVSSAPEDLVLGWDGGQYLGSTPVGTDLKTARLNVDGVAIAELVDSDIRVDYLVDALGSVTGVTNASGSVKRDARYSPYGTLLFCNQFEWGWTGNSGSRHTGVPYAEQYNWNRHYSSRTKQWTSRDILWPNELAYGYVIGNPANWIDAVGMQPIFGPPSPYTKSPIGSPIVPKYWPNDVDIEENCCIAASHQSADFWWWISMVLTGHPWDYKDRTKEIRIDDRGSQVNPLEDFGNWHYGAMAACMGMTIETALLGASIAQYVSDKMKGIKPKWRGFPGMWDPKEDTIQILLGYLFAKWKLRNTIERCKTCGDRTFGPHNPPSNQPVRPLPNPNGMPGDWWRTPTSPIYY